MSFLQCYAQEVAKSDHVQRKLAKRQATRTLDPLLDEQVASGRFLACISSRPGQVRGAPFKNGWSVKSLHHVLCVRGVFFSTVVVKRIARFFFVHVLPCTSLIDVDYLGQLIPLASR